MKIGVRNPDGKPGWNIVNPAQNPIWVWLDDRKVERCVAANDSAGEVWVTAIGKHGEILIDHDRNEVLLEKRTGKVEIRMLQS